MVIKSRFAESFFGKSNTAEMLYAPIVNNMECKVFITDPEHLLENCSPDDRVGTHPIGAGLAFVALGVKVLHRQFINGIVLMNNLADAI